MPIHPINPSRKGMYLKESLYLRKQYVCLRMSQMTVTHAFENSLGVNL